MIRLVGISFVGAGATALVGAPFIGFYAIALMPFGASFAAGAAAICIARTSAREPADLGWRHGASTDAPDHPLLRAGQLLSVD